MTDDNQSRKAELRSSIRTAIKNMDEQKRATCSSAACQRLFGLEEFRRAGVVMLYVPLPDEIDLTTVAIRCFQLGKTVCVPHVDWQREDMFPVEVTSFDDEHMHVDERGLRRPREGRPVPLTAIDVVIVPGLAFDVHGHRLGRGGGFYDRFLVRLGRRTTLIGIACDKQIVDAIPIDDHDIPMDLVVTDRRVAHGAQPQRHQ